MAEVCGEAICLDDLRVIGTWGAVRIGIGYEGGRPFSGLVIDLRSGHHLHFPAADVQAMLAWPMEPSSLEL